VAVDEVNGPDEADELADITMEEALSLLQADLTNKAVAEFIQPATQVDLVMQGVLPQLAEHYMLLIPITHCVREHFLFKNHFFLHRDTLCGYRYGIYLQLSRV
jgi:hypothetical protein